MNIDQPNATPKRGPGRPIGSGKRPQTDVVRVRMLAGDVETIKRLAKLRNMTMRQLFVSFLERDPLIRRN